MEEEWMGDSEEVVGIDWEERRKRKQQLGCKTKN